MGLGRIASLLGSLHPAAETQQAPPELALNDRPAAAAEGPHTSYDRNAGGKTDVAAQIQAVITAIQQLHDSSSQDGAGMAFSHSGTTLRDSVGALGHLMAAARDSGVPLSADLVKEAEATVAAVDTRLQTVREGIEQRAQRTSGAEEARIREVAGRFLAEMQAAVAHTQSVIARFGL
ncbi:MAG: hypothetical protein AB1918_10500 [Pseudomonadota bacterium]